MRRTLLARHGLAQGLVLDAAGAGPALQLGQCVVAVDPRYFRPTEVETLLGDPTKAKEKLGWQPAITAQEMCAEMVAEDLAAAQRLTLLRAHGHHLAVPRETN